MGDIMKKQFLILIVIGICVFLTSCGKNQSSTTQKRQATVTETTTRATTVEPAQAMGQQSDLCTDTNCPGVVR